MRRREFASAALAACVGPSRAAERTSFSWYCWSAQAWLAQPADLLAALPAGSSRMLLGLNAHELASASFGRDARLARLMEAARASGIAVELLLGDPHWVLPAGRRHLSRIVEQAAHLPFAGLNLDIERTQLPEVSREAWREGLLGTLADVRSRTEWPLTLTTHHEELTHLAFVGELAAAGVAELMPMIYVSFEHLVLERAFRVFTANASLPAAARMRVTVAQSFERALPRGESWRRFGQEGALREWQRLGARLAANREFAGIAVQSIDEFRQA